MAILKITVLITEAIHEDCISIVGVVQNNFIMIYSDDMKIRKIFGSCRRDSHVLVELKVASPDTHYAGNYSARY